MYVCINIKGSNLKKGLFSFPYFLFLNIFEMIQIEHTKDEKKIALFKISILTIKDKNSTAEKM